MATNKIIRDHLNNYGESLLKDIQEKKECTGGDNEKEIVLSLYEDKCQGWCKAVSSLSDEALQENSKQLQSIAQLVLDVTYVDECCLVNDEFPTQTAWGTVNAITESLRSIEKLARHVIPTKELKSSLGEEIVECLHWRRGALCYMYCHTLNSSQQEGGSFPDHYRQCLESGVCELMSMLRCRTSPSWLEGGKGGGTTKTGSDATTQKSHSARDQQPDCSDADTSKLFEDGILSDTHMLALMYCGEMCYWHTQALRGGDVTFVNAAKQPQSGLEPADLGISSLALSSSPSHLENDIVKSGENSVTTATTTTTTISSSRQTVMGKDVSGDDLSDTSRGGDRGGLYVNIGRLCLEKYVELSRGPLSIGGWSTTQAETFLQYFSTL